MGTATATYDPAAPSLDRREMTRQDRSGPTDDRIDGVASYREDGALVVCSRTVPRAWIRSDVTVSLRDLEVEPANAP